MFFLKGTVNEKGGGLRFNSLLGEGVKGLGLCITLRGVCGVRG